jgi:hypothetical protein
VEAVPPAVTVPSAAPPLDADAPVPRAAGLRAAASDSIAPRADRGVAQRPPEVIPGVPAAPVPRTAQPGVPALRIGQPNVLAAQADLTGQPGVLVAQAVLTGQPDVPVALAVLTGQPGVLMAQAVLAAQVPTRAPVPARVMQGHDVAIAIDPGPRNGPAAMELQIQQPAPAVPSAARSATANRALPAIHASAEPNVAARRVVRLAQVVMRAIHAAAAAQAARNTDHGAPFLRPASHVPQHAARARALRLARNAVQDVASPRPARRVVRAAQAVMRAIHDGAVV